MEFDVNQHSQPTKRLVTLSTYRRYTNNCIYLSIYLNRTQLPRSVAGQRFQRSGPPATTRMTREILADPTNPLRKL